MLIDLTCYSFILFSWFLRYSSGQVISSTVQKYETSVNHGLTYFYAWKEYLFCCTQVECSVYNTTLNANQIPTLIGKFPRNTASTGIFVNDNKYYTYRYDTPYVDQYSLAGVFERRIELKYSVTMDP
jgi:hypothetical protein